MTVNKESIGGVWFATIDENQICLTDEQSALDLIGLVIYGAGCNRLILTKDQLDPAFFELKTGLAGAVLQKFTNYQVKLAIVGDFSRYPSSSLRDFMGESNRGKSLAFVATKAEAAAKLT